MKDRKRCPGCRGSSKLVEDRVDIPLGKERFRAVTWVCRKCGHYLLTPRIRREMDEWGRANPKAMVEPQPIFSDAAHGMIDQLGASYGLKKVEVIKALTAFYLHHIVTREDFGALKEAVSRHESTKMLQGQGDRSKICVPIRYLMYRKLQTYCEAWGVSHAKAIENGVLFGLVVLSMRDGGSLREVAERLRQNVEEFALAA